MLDNRCDSGVRVELNREVFAVLDPARQCLIDLLSPPLLKQLCFFFVEVLACSCNLLGGGIGNGIENTVRVFECDFDIHGLERENLKVEEIEASKDGNRLGENVGFDAIWIVAVKQLQPHLAAVLPQELGKV